MQNKIIIRAAQKKDVAAINEILNDAIKNTYVNWAWTERSHDDALKWFSEHDCHRYCVFVAELGGRVVGYGSLSAFRSKEGYWPVAENSVYIHKDFRRRKIGTLLMEMLIGRAGTSGLRAISAWIDSGNTESIKMHEKFGFYITGEMKNAGEKFGEKRSVTIMQLDIGEKGDNHGQSG